jgi:hypothetical protein
METKVKTPQLVWDRGVAIWRATRAAIKPGFPTKRVNLKIFDENEAALVLKLGKRRENRVCRNVSRT